LNNKREGGKTQKENLFKKGRERKETFFKKAECGSPLKLSETLNNEEIIRRRVKMRI
jgi:hypothetical protein